MQTHLFRRGAACYRRGLVPTALQRALGSRDFRVSLRTNLPETARSRARQLDAAFDLALEELERVMRSGEILSEALQSRLIREFRQEIIDTADDDRPMSGRRDAGAITAAVAKALNRN